MAAIQYDGVDATLTFPDAGVEESDILSLSGGALLAQNYTASIPLYGEPTVSEGTKEFWG